jgi:hypothetical protein
MHLSILDDMHQPGGARLLCSGTSTAANYETPLQFALPQRAGSESGQCFGDRRRANMKAIRINADAALWRNNMLPEGILEHWLVADGAIAREGHAVAQVRIEGALHDIVAPVTGRLTIVAPRLAVIEPGFLLATLTAEAAAGA